MNETERTEIFRNMTKTYNVSLIILPHYLCKTIPPLKPTFLSKLTILHLEKETVLKLSSSAGNLEPANLI